MLAGLPNAPSAYDPLKNYTLARQRQRLVLENMVDAGYISNAKADQIYQEPCASPDVFVSVLDVFGCPRLRFDVD